MIAEKSYQAIGLNGKTVTVKERWDTEEKTLVSQEILIEGKVKYPNPYWFFDIFDKDLKYLPIRDSADRGLIGPALIRVYRILARVTVTLVFIFIPIAIIGG